MIKFNTKMTIKLDSFAPLSSFIMGSRVGVSLFPLHRRFRHFDGDVHWSVASLLLCTVVFVQW